MFDITLERRGRMIDAAGEIIIGDFKSVFTFDLSYWSPEDYRASWQRTAALVLEHGFGRFLVSVGAPGAMFETWPCWRAGDEARVIHSFILSSISVDFARVEDAETFASESPELDPGRADTLKIHPCSLADIADFERRLLGASAQ